MKWGLSFLVNVFNNGHVADSTILYTLGKNCLAIILCANEMSVYVIRNGSA